MKKNRVLKAAAVLLLCAVLCGCSSQYYGGITERTDGLPNAYTRDILPESQGNVGGEKITATLYFRYLGEDWLVGVEQEFQVTAENTLEELVVQALIDGPQDSAYQYSALINEDTRLIRVQEQSGCLSITLSGEFLERTDQDIESEAKRRQLAVQSIVNSVTSIGNYSRVLILLDENNTGLGERLTFAEAGWEEMGDRTIEPMELDDSVILTPENVMDIAMSALVEKDYERLEYFLANRDYDGEKRPTYTEFSSALSKKASVVGFEIAQPAIVSGNGDRAVILLDITYIDAGGKTAELDSLPVRMVREDVWKVSYRALNDMIPAY